MALGSIVGFVSAGIARKSRIPKIHECGILSPVEDPHNLGKCKGWIHRWLSAHNPAPPRFVYNEGGVKKFQRRSSATSVGCDASTIAENKRGVPPNRVCS